MSKISIIDIGSNSVMMSVFDITETTPEQIEEYYQVTQLGEGASKDRVLKEEPLNRTVNAVKKLKSIAVSQGITDIIATTTSAVRDAHNKEIFFKKMEEATDITPVLLSGEDEAMLTFKGASSGFSLDEIIVTADPGGGSTEINIGCPAGDILYSKSFQAGCVRFTDDFGFYEKISIDQLEKLRKYLRELFLEISDNNKAKKLVISGGTATTFGAIKLKMDNYSSSAINNLYATTEELDHIIVELSKMDIEKRKAVPGVEDARAKVLPAGLLIISELAKCLKFNGFYITTNGLRYGVALHLAQGNLLNSIV